MFKSATYIFIFFALTSLDANAQDAPIIVSGKFASDSIKLGEPVDFYLTASYPASATILFPDTTFRFAPFEIQKKKYFSTRTKDSMSYDSAVYSLTSFEIDSLQMLRLPVFLVEPKDCLTIFSQTDTLFFKKLVASVPDSLAVNNLPLKTNTDYRKVSWQLNYLLLSLIGGILIIVVLIIWIVFGKSIRKYFVTQKLNKEFKEFAAQFETAVEKLNQQFSPPHAELALVIWKRYLEKLQSVPYTKYTSKEIKEKEANDELGQNLSLIDRMIYGNGGELASNAFAYLKEYGEAKYLKRMEEVKHG